MPIIHTRAMAVCSIGYDKTIDGEIKIMAFSEMSISVLA